MPPTVLKYIILLAVVAGCTAHIPKLDWIMEESESKGASIETHGNELLEQEQQQEQQQQEQQQQQANDWKKLHGIMTNLQSRADCATLLEGLCALEAMAMELDSRAPTAPLRRAVLQQQGHAGDPPSSVSSNAEDAAHGDKLEVTMDHQVPGERVDQDPADAHREFSWPGYQSADQLLGGYPGNDPSAHAGFVLAFLLATGLGDLVGFQPAIPLGFSHRSPPAQPEDDLFQAGGQGSTVPPAAVQQTLQAGVLDSAAAETGPLTGLAGPFWEPPPADIAYWAAQGINITNRLQDRPVLRSVKAARRLRAPMATSCKAAVSSSMEDRPGQTAQSTGQADPALSGVRRASPAAGGGNHVHSSHATEGSCSSIPVYTGGSGSDSTFGSALHATTASDAPAGMSVAVYWLHKAAAAGHHGAQLALADRYAYGRGVPFDPAEGVRRARIVVEAIVENLEDSLYYPMPDPAVLLRERHRKGWSSHQPAARQWEEEEELAYEMEEALGGLPYAQRLAGFRYLVGHGVDRDYDAALTMLLEAADAGDPEAYYFIATASLKGLGVEVNYTRALRYFEAAALQGVAEAYNSLGDMALKGLGQDADADLARLYYESGYAQHDPDCAYNLGLLYDGGVGVEPNHTLAYEYFQTALHLNHWRAPYALAMMYEEGRGLADEGDHPLQRNLTAAEDMLRLFLLERSHWPRKMDDAFEHVDAGDKWAAFLHYAALAEQGCPTAVANMAWLAGDMGLQPPIDPWDPVSGCRALQNFPEVPVGDEHRHSEPDNNAVAGYADELTAEITTLADGALDHEAGEDSSGPGAAAAEAAGQARRPLAKRHNGAAAAGAVRDVRTEQAAARQHWQQRVLTWHFRAGMRGVAESWNDAANLLYLNQLLPGHGQTSHRSTALELYTRAAGWGDTEAMCNIAYMNLIGEAPLQPNRTAARHWYTKALSEAPAFAYKVPPFLALLWLTVGDVVLALSHVAPELWSHVRGSPTVLQRLCVEKAHITKRTLVALSNTMGRVLTFLGSDTVSESSRDSGSLTAMPGVAPWFWDNVVLAVLLALLLGVAARLHTLRSWRRQTAGQRQPTPPPPIAGGTADHASALQ